MEETAESAYQRKAAAAYDKYGARDERRQPLLPASLQALPLLPGVDHETADADATMQSRTSAAA